LDLLQSVETVTHEIFARRQSTFVENVSYFAMLNNAEIAR